MGIISRAAILRLMVQDLEKNGPVSPEETGPGKETRFLLENGRLPICINQNDNRRFS